jgi:hypothetical protein
MEDVGLIIQSEALWRYPITTTEAPFPRPLLWLKLMDGWIVGWLNGWIDKMVGWLIWWMVK